MITRFDYFSIFNALEIFTEFFLKKESCRMSLLSTSEWTKKIFHRKFCKFVKKSYFLSYCIEFIEFNAFLSTYILWNNFRRNRPRSKKRT